jgi:GMP synthase-like glutamine amidotransferase
VTQDRVPEFAIPYPDDSREDYMRLEKETGPIVCILDTKHPEVIARQWHHTENLKRRAAELTGLPCLLIHYTWLRLVNLNRSNIKAVMINPNVKPINTSYTESLYAFVRTTAIPTIGFCGGHHQVYQAFGGICEDMRMLHPGEPDPNPDYQPGWFKEWGFMPVEITKPDPLFTDLGKEIIVRLEHVSHCTRVPADFEVLARTAECPVQALKHRNKLLYSTQFHPEAYDDEHLDGKIILQNFFTLAGITQH